MKSTPPSLPTSGDGTPQQQGDQLRHLPEQRLLKVNPELDARLNTFMQANSRMADYYTQLVKENPERAVRALMLSRMVKHESQMASVQRQLPQVEAWVREQPGLMERITDRIKNVSPMYREKAFVGEAMRAKARVDFAPPKAGLSIAA